MLQLQLAIRPLNASLFFKHTRTLEQKEIKSLALSTLLIITSALFISATMRRHECRERNKGKKETCMHTKERKGRGRE